ncbi:hypothetical protein VTI28DRAFT_619 [Corynascus sepedonium]
MVMRHCGLKKEKGGASCVKGRILSEGERSVIMSRLLSCLSGVVLGAWAELGFGLWCWRGIPYIHMTYSFSFVALVRSCSLYFWSGIEPWVMSAYSQPGICDRPFMHRRICFVTLWYIGRGCSDDGIRTTQIDSALQCTELPVFVHNTSAHLRAHYFNFAGVTCYVRTRRTQLHAMESKVN